MTEWQAKRPLRIALVIGEESGDQLGASLIDAIRRQRPDAEFTGLAGERMQARGMRSLFSIGEVAVMGLVPIVRRLPRIYRRGQETVEAVLEAEPDALVIIDSPGFTHAVAKRVKRRKPVLPVIDYVSPSVWAWGPWRARKMARYVDHVLALLPFEPEAHKRLGGPPCTYVGHPLNERLAELRPSPGERQPLEVGTTLLVLPGSRRTEIARLMQPFGEAVRLIAERRPGTEILLPAVSHLKGEIEKRLSAWPVKPRLVEGEAQKFAAFRRAHAALAASGTVTLELGLAGVPMVVAYRVEPLARALKHAFLSVPSIVLVNLVLGENAVPEFLDGKSTPEALAQATLELLSDTPARKAQLDALGCLIDAMNTGGRSASDRAADIVLAAAARRSAHP